MGTETKSNCYSENTASDINSVQKLSSDTNNSCKNNGKYLSTSVAAKVTNSLISSSNVELSNQKVTVASQVPFVPIHFDENAVIEGAKEILKVIRPTWNINYVHFKVISLIISIS